MIQVSNEFKKAIKEPERRIKGYVEVLYDLPSVTVTPSVNVTSTYTPTSEISNGVRVENLYGSVDYLPLDGSYITMGNTNTNIGYISDELFENLTNPTVTLSFSSTKINGITMYFRENPPTNMTLNYSDGTSQTITNEENTVQVIFDSPKTLTSVSITINDMMYQDRKIYIMEIDLGVTQVYKDQDLIEFTVDEEINKLVEEVPINETNIILNNMSDLFNPLNPKGIVPYLSENTLIKPYIGVLTEAQGVEYVKMGEFYFDSYTNNSDSTTTLVGKNIIKQLKMQELKDDNNVNIFSVLLTKDTIISFLDNFDYSVGEINMSNLLLATILKTKTLLDFIKEITFFSNSIFNIDRDNSINIRPINTAIMDSITKSELIEDAKYKKIDRINKLVRDGGALSGIQQESSKTIFEKSIILTKSTESVLCYAENNMITNSTVTQTGGQSIQWGPTGWFLGFANVTGQIGDEVKITVTGDTIIERESSIYEVSNKRDGEKEVKLNVIGSMNSSDFAKGKLLEYTPSYEMSIDYNGDPSLEAGDYINVETPYGYKPLFIQKNRFKFDGGLTGSIEGVE